MQVPIKDKKLLHYYEASDCCVAAKLPVERLRPRVNYKLNVNMDSTTELEGNGEIWPIIWRPSLLSIAITRDKSALDSK